jgi:signal transduction histidine kinase
MRPPVRLPLAAWAAVLTLATVAATAGVTAALLGAAWSGPRPLVAVVLGALAGVVVSGVSALAAAAAVRSASLRCEALVRGDSSGSPRMGRRGGGPVREVAGLLADSVALRRRVLLADAVAEHHRQEALSAGAGVSALLAGLVEAEEGARGQLAAELHDTVAQSLMTARSLLAVRPATARQVAQVTDYVEDAEEQLRAAMARTRPPALRDGDVATAMEALCSDLRARYGLEVSVSWPATEHLMPLPTAVTLYRFFQEALLNVVKHADVDDATVALEIRDDAVVATVRDEGPGFEPAAVVSTRGRHVGLALMRERARLCGGTLEVEGGAAGGTVLRLRLPRAAARPLPAQRTSVEGAAPAPRPPVLPDSPPLRAGPGVRVSVPAQRSA